MKQVPSQQVSIAGEELKIERTAREMGIDLDGISANDFQVTIEPIDYTAGSSSPLPGAKVNIRIAVSADYPVDELMGDVEYRIGNCAWRSLMEGRIDGRSCNRLERREVEADGPVELRIDSVRASGTGKVWGPYRYDMSVSKSMELWKSKAAAEVVTAWDTHGDEWIIETAEGWRIELRNEFISPDYIQALQMGEKPDDLRLTIPLDPEELRFQQTAIETFRDRSRFFADSPVLYVRLQFPEGTFSTIRKFPRSLVNTPPQRPR